MSFRIAQRRGLDVLVTGTASDSHTWNLIFLQLFCEERGHRVINLGPCVPEDLLVAACRASRPDLVVVSSVNGHGFADGLRAINALRRPDLVAVPVVIGGKLSTDGVVDAGQLGRLLDAGYTEVFGDGELAGFDRLLEKLASGACRVAS